VVGRADETLFVGRTNLEPKLRKMRSSFPACAPKGPNDHLGIIEGVIEVAAEPLKIETPKSGVLGLRVDGAHTRQDGDDAKSFAEFGGEEVAIVPVLEPPGLLTVDVTSRRGGEPDTVFGQRARSSRCRPWSISHSRHDSKRIVSSSVSIERHRDVP
jgi:hypothetical protein